MGKAYRRILLDREGGVGQVNTKTLARTACFVAGFCGIVLSFAILRIGVTTANETMNYGYGLLAIVLFAFLVGMSIRCVQIGACDDI